MYEMEQDFGLWMIKYDKSYSNDKEMTQRREIWSRNQETVSRHNEEAAKGGHTFTLEMNHLADLTNAEYRNAYLGYQSTTVQATETFSPHASADGPPANFNWMDTGTSTDVKNQGSCASCWSFAAVAALESAYNQRHKGLPSMDKACVGVCGPQSTRCCTFSEQQFVDCAKNGTDNCVKGGEPNDAFQVAQDNGKINTEKQYAYTSGGGVAKGACHFNANASVVVNISAFANVTSLAQKATEPYGNETALKYAVWQQGVIAVGIDSSSTKFQLYANGVYSNPTCKKKCSQLDHAVSVVGYGSDGGKAYWLVKNSWGKPWGMGGYIFMARGTDNECGIASDASYPILATPLPPSPPPAPTPAGQCAVPKHEMIKCSKRQPITDKKTCDQHRVPGTHINSQCCWKQTKDPKDIWCYQHKPF
jgi:C1A family cysteine protease